MASQTLEYQVAEVFSQTGYTISVAESCTGGLLAGRLTEVSGSSKFFLGGVVSYANEVKENLLDVSADTLLTFGAVSEQTALEMAQGVRNLLHTDVAISITGVAGPTGGTPEKPVGLVWIGLSDRQGTQAVRCLWAGDRVENRRLSVDQALQMLLDWAEKQQGTPGAL